MRILLDQKQQEKLVLLKEIVVILDIILLVVNLKVMMVPIGVVFGGVISVDQETHIIAQDTTDGLENVGSLILTVDNKEALDNGWCSR